MTSSNLRPIVAAVASTGRHATARPPEPAAPSPTLPFVTISRQAGAGGHVFGQTLARRLTEISPGARSWELLDRELVEHVTREHRVPASLVHHFEDASRNWLVDLVEGLQYTSNEPGELAVYHRVAQTIVALAGQGRVVLVGRGAAFITRGLAGGVHVYLVAPLEERVAQFARRHDLGRDEAARQVRDIDANRAAFYRRHWPGIPVAPESFTITLNVAAAPIDRLVDAAVPLVLQPARPAAMRASAG